MSRLILDRIAQAKESSNRIAILDIDQTLTYSELRTLSSSFAAKIAHQVSSESPVGLLAPSGCEYVIGLITAWRLGAIAAPLQPAHPLDELRYIIENTGLKTLLIHPRLREQAKELVQNTSIDIVEIDISDLKTAKDTLLEDRRTLIGDDDGALIIYTSGTTSRPKGVVTSYAALDSQIRCLIEAWEWSDQDRTVNALPLHHVHGVVNVLCCSLAAGATCEMMEKFDPRLLWERFTSGEISVFMAVPTIYSKLADCFDKQDETTQSRFTSSTLRMRLMVSGSAALPKPLFEKWESITGHRLLERYGMTEIGMALSNPLNGNRKPGTVGKALPRVQVRLRSEDGIIIESQDTPGEVLIKGPNLFREYWKNTEATRSAFTEDGWFQTGDVAQIDKDGYFTILGRLSQDIIKSGGYKISALEIESALLEISGIKEAAVVGLADDVWGECVAAAIVGSITIPDIQFQLSRKIAKYKIPTKWISCESLPRNAMGKTVKSEVKKLFKS